MFLVLDNGSRRLYHQPIGYRRCEIGYTQSAKNYGCISEHPPIFLPICLTMVTYLIDHGFGSNFLAVEVELDLMQWIFQCFKMFVA